jgi:hypothetical protein
LKNYLAEFFVSFLMSAVAFWARTLIEQKPFQYNAQLSMQGINLSSAMDLLNTAGLVLIKGQNFVIIENLPS